MLDKYNREKGIKAFEKKYKSKITKSNITQRDYNKFMTIDTDKSRPVNIDFEKVA